MPTKKELELQIKELKEENQLYLTTILKVLYEDLDGELTGPGNHDSNGTALHSLYANLRYETFNSDLKQDLTNFLKYYAEKVEDAESRWFEIIELKEEIEKLKKHYETDLMEWKGKNKSLQDMLDLYIEASN